MKVPRYSSQLSESKSRRSCLCTVFPVLALVFCIGTVLVASDYKETLWSTRNVSDSNQSSIHISEADDRIKGSIPIKCENLSHWEMTDSPPNTTESLVDNPEVVDTVQESKDSKPNKCKNQCRPLGSASLPLGIVTTSSNLEMRPLWGFPEKDPNLKNLMTIPVGIKQKVLVNKMVEKFLSSGFVIMLFHYDGNVDKWKEFKWCDNVIHVSAMNQTKWWFAKRFLHPEIVAEYDYIFIWDEDLGLDSFDPQRYLAIVQEEGLEISQPGLDPAKSEIHHLITVRKRNSIVHRRAYKPGKEGKQCDDNSTGPPCTGWIEVMAPVFSREAWRCVWHMVQNDLIHAWGLDIQLGYCAQGDRIKKVGVVDSEYIVHHGLPTLGADDAKKVLTPSRYNNLRVNVRRQSYDELNIFRKRWKKAADEDTCWVDPYRNSSQIVIQSIHQTNVR